MRIWYHTRQPGLGWFRLFGVGLHWKDTSRHRLLFSEREGYKRPTLEVGSWWFTILRRGRAR